MYPFLFPSKWCFSSASFTQVQRMCGEKRFNQDGADYLRMSYHSGVAVRCFPPSWWLVPVQEQNRSWFITTQTSPLVVALCWTVLPWLPEQVLPGSVCIAQVIGWDGGFFPLSPRTTFFPKWGKYSLFVVCRHRLKNTAVTSTVWFHVPTQMLCELRSLHQHSLFLATQTKAWPTQFQQAGRIKHPENPAWLQGDHVRSCKIMTCSAQRCCCVFIVALLQLSIPDASCFSVNTCTTGTRVEAIVLYLKEWGKK